MEFVLLKLINNSLLEPTSQHLYTTSRGCVWIPNEKLDENL